jgi:hypothetical protein
VLTLDERGLIAGVTAFLGPPFASFGLPAAIDS